MKYEHWISTDEKYSTPMIPLGSICRCLFIIESIVIGTTATGTKFWTQVNLQYCHYVSSQEYKCTNHFSLKRKKSNEGISRKCKSKLLFLRKCQIFIGNWFKFSPRYHCLNQLFSADAEIPSFVLYQLPKLRYDQFWDNFLRSFSGNYSEVKQHRAQSVLGWVTVCSSKKLKNSIFSTFPRYFFF